MEGWLAIPVEDLLQLHVHKGTKEVEGSEQHLADEGGRHALSHQVALRVRQSVDLELHGADGVEGLHEPVVEVLIKVHEGLSHPHDLCPARAVLKPCDEAVHVLFELSGVTLGLLVSVLSLKVQTRPLIPQTCVRPTTPYLS